MGKRKNLHMYLETWVNKLELSADGKTVVGVRMTSKDGNQFVLKAKHEVLLAAGAVDTPRLMLLSGIGPKKDLEDLGIVSRVDLPGVGENLVDHPESIIMWEVDELPPQTVMQSDTAYVFLRPSALKLADRLLTRQPLHSPRHYRPSPRPHVSHLLCSFRRQHRASRLPSPSSRHLHGEQLPRSV